MRRSLYENIFSQVCGVGVVATPGETGTLVAIGSGSLYRESRESPLSTGDRYGSSVAERFDGS